MKTIQHTKTGHLKRRSDKSAKLWIKKGDWKYVPKSIWKEVVRDKPSMITCIGYRGEE
jgi:hypothetical protein